MAGETGVVPTIPSVTGTGPLSGQSATIALGLTAFLLLWQFCLLAVAARTLHVVNDAYNIREIFIIG